MNQGQTIRVLHAVGGMDRGGTETWLVHVLAHLDPARFQTDFLVHHAGPFAYEKEIEKLGGRLLVCPAPHRPWRYARAFRRIMAEHGPYDIVHGHLQHFNGLVMRLARKANVSVRIAHSHLDSSGEQGASRFFRRLYFRLMNCWIDRHATAGLAASRQAAAALFGERWEENDSRRLLYCGIDLAPFQEDVPRARLRAALGIPAGAFVLGHAGRMMDQKNHKFLISVAAEAARQDRRVCLLLVGDGPLRASIENQVQLAGLSDRVIFAGVRPDVPRLMLGAMDVLVLPSLCEGLPLVGMEALAAGLPLVVSDVVTSELDAIPELVHRIPLTASAQIWAERILALRKSPRPVTQTDALARMTGGPFDIQTGVHELAELYGQEIERARQGGLERSKDLACPVGTNHG